MVSPNLFLLEWRSRYFYVFTTTIGFLLTSVLGGLPIGNKISYADINTKHRSASRQFVVASLLKKSDKWFYCIETLLQRCHRSVGLMLHKDIRDNENWLRLCQTHTCNLTQLQTFLML